MKADPDPAILAIARAYALYGKRFYFNYINGRYNVMLDGALVDTCRTSTELVTTLDELVGESRHHKHTTEEEP